MSAFTDVARCLFENVWRMVTQVEYPGVGVSVAAVFCGVLIICISIRVIRSILFSGGGSK